jgi:peptidoglycan/xylan/chitin deacetylase (PgdA/CDA1 family)
MCPEKSEHIIHGICTEKAVLLKAIISHDVDHLSVWEHRKDLMVPKFILRSFAEFVSGRIAAMELAERTRGLIGNHWQNLESLMAFDASRGIPSTFFFAVSRGKGLSYGPVEAGSWMRRILEAGFDIGIHGICHDDPGQIKKEYDAFRLLSGLDGFGIRMHYLRVAPRTLDYLDQAGYLFDSSLYALQAPFFLNKMIEFPLHLMDDDFIYGGGRMQQGSLDAVMMRTRARIDEAYRHDLKYVTVLFHDRYFCDAFPLWKAWYRETVAYLQSLGIDFINYRQALTEMNAGKTADGGVPALSGSGT